MCNDPLYKEDAVEVFITTKEKRDSNPSQYLELELSPKGTAFASVITNNGDDCSSFSGSSLQCQNKAFFFSAEIESFGIIFFLLFLFSHTIHEQDGLQQSKLI
jgi:hypothetical protein